MQFFLLVLLAALAVAFANDGIVEIDPEKFSEQVVGDDKVWLVEFFSSMCGSCQEFSPTWKKIVHKAKTVMKGEVNIDTPKGMALAQKLGALDEGIPNVRMFSRMGDPKGKSIVNGETKTNYEAVARSIKTNMQGLEKADHGFLTKRQ